MFPYIDHIDQLLAHVGHKPEIRIAEHEGQMAGYKTACYMIANKDTFDDEWARECRGITFYPDGRIASRSMHKFFNVGEREETQEHVLDFNDVESIMDKRDGSMVHPVPLLNGKGFVMKSKKSFESDVAIAATKFSAYSLSITAFVNYCIANSLTPTFEYTSPHHRIVLNYKNEDMHLLHIRENASGRYFSRDEIHQLVNSDVWYDAILKRNQHFNKDIDIIKVVDVIPDTYQNLRANIDSAVDIEGYIIKFKSGEMVKLKTPWYLALHHNVTFPTQRTIAKMVIDETIDDYKSYLTMVGASHDAVNEIESHITCTIQNIETEVSRMFAFLRSKHGEDRKAWAMDANKHPFFKLIMDMFSGKSIDYAAFYERNFLKNDFTTEQV
jgi:RNA ligase